ATPLWAQNLLSAATCAGRGARLNDQKGRHALRDVPALLISAPARKKNLSRLRAQQLQQGALFRQILRLLAADAPLPARAKLFERDAHERTLQHLRMNVAVATDGRRVAQARGHALERADDVAPRLHLILCLAYIGQRDGREQSPAPRAKVFGRELR